MLRIKNKIVNYCRYRKLLFDRHHSHLPFRSVYVRRDSEICFTVTGWIYPAGVMLSDSVLRISSSDNVWHINIPSKIKTMDKDIKDYLHLGNGARKIYSFHSSFRYESSEVLKLELCCQIGGDEVVIKLGDIPSNLCSRSETIILPHRHKLGPVDDDGVGVDYIDCGNIDTIGHEVDIVLPIYNGFDYFDALFSSIEKTNCRYRLFIVNDCSTDNRVKEFLKKYSTRDEVVLIENSENLGFVRSVNKGLKRTNKDVILLNSDTEMPMNWIERLMAPIWEDYRIASVTPFTNSGTICSFPNFCDNNEIFEGLDVESVDNEFSKLQPKTYAVPTGVGFCMGMSRVAIKEVGFLDEDTFGKGFGEENDWCQRALRAGYKNVHVNNLFVYHKHGGSFSSEEKKQLIENNTRLINHKYPDYSNDVNFYFLRDPAYNDRFDVFSRLLKLSNQKKTMIIGNLYGGGATAFANTRINELLKDNHIVLSVSCKPRNCEFLLSCKPIEPEWKPDSYEGWIYVLTCYVSGSKTEVDFERLSDLFEYVGSVDVILINGLQGFPNIDRLVTNIRNFKREHNARIFYYVHDYYCVCPWYTLTGVHDRFCELPSCATCNSCFDKYFDKNTICSYSITDYRNEMRALLSECSEIVSFSKSSISILNTVFPDLKNITLKPHSDSYLDLDFKSGRPDVFTIGIMGAVAEDKGFNVICELVDYIESESKNSKIVLFGYTHIPINNKIIKITGRYDCVSINNLLTDNPIDVFFLPSVWPETFSFATSEMLSTGMPVVCFDVGAPAERISEYKLGRVIPLNSDSKDIYDALVEASQLSSKIRSM